MEGLDGDDGISQQQRAAKFRVVEHQLIGICLRALRKRHREVVEQVIESSANAGNLEAGVRRFDSSLGGIGGSPFADGAAGNIATETLVYLLDDQGFQTAIDLQQLLAVTPLLSQMIGHRLPSALARLHSGERRGAVVPQ